jgi:peptide/nickel transport system permease protein
MAIFFIQRIGFTIIGLLVTSILVFSISEVLPGDVAQVILGPTATPESLQKVRSLLELDKPAHLRYLNWLNGVIHGDFGTSLTMPGVSINSLIARRLINSLILATF